MSSSSDVSQHSKQVADVKANDTCATNSEAPIKFRLYKRRFSGVIGMIILNVVGAMCWPWFGPISNNVSAEFNISLNDVNWLGNLVACVYLPAALLIPSFITRYGIRRACDVGAICLVISAWVRYSGTVRTIPPRGAYALLMVGQLFGSIAQPIFQVLGPKYSETWFNLQGRTTATMAMSIANPVGGAVGQLISPLVVDTRKSILVLGIICSAGSLAVFLVGNAPPTPPTYSGTRKSRSMLALVRRLLGHDKSDGDDLMTPRERMDFIVVLINFSACAGSVNAFAVLTAQIVEPVGYSSDTAGFMGATLLLSGIVAAIITAPLFDRVFTQHLALTAKVALPIIAICWLSMIWAVKENNIGGLFAIMAVLGITSITMLPVALELACDLTRNADGSSSLLWFGGNLFAIMFILVESALRADEYADPPLNMRRALVFNGSFVMICASTIFLLKGKQVRKEQDEAKIQQARATMAMMIP